MLTMCLSGCSKDGDEFTGFGPEIEWISGGTTMTYIYSRGVVAGYNFKRSVEVKKGSGEIEISIGIKGNSESKITEKFEVEKGKQYKFSIRGGISGRIVSSPMESCMTVVFSSPNCHDSYEIKVNSYTVMSSNEYVPDMDYCPESLVLSEIIISEGN